MDPILLAVQLLLSLCSVLGTLAAEPRLLGAELWRLGLALALTFMVARLSSFWLLRYARWFFLLALGLLVLILFIGNGPGAVRRWFHPPGLGGLGFQFSGVMKLALPAYLATLYPRPNSRYAFVRRLLAIGLAAGLVALEPDLGTAILLLLTGFAVLLVTGISWRRLAVMVAATGGVLLALTLLAPRFQYVQTRLLAFVAYLQGRGDPHGGSYQILQAHQVMHTGILGHGLAPMPHVPAASTDMVFAALVYAGGWLAGGAVLLCYLLFLGRGLYLARAARGQAGALAFGLTVIITLQAAINLGVVFGVLPVTGMALPLVSYGGSSMVVTGVALGLLHGVYRSTLRHSRS
jgi:cell division protein FtsW